MATTSTYDQLAKRLLVVAKNKDMVIDLFGALSRLQEGMAALGDTVLVVPTVHPLAQRQLLPRAVGYDE